MTDPLTQTHFAKESGLTGAWPELLDALLRGVGHVLSNRIGALMAVAELHSDETYRSDPAHLAIEIERLTELTRLLKLLPAEVAPRMEGVLPADVLTDALALMALHPRARELEWRRESARVYPVRVHRHVLLRATLLLLDAARRDGERAGARKITVMVGGDETVATIAARAGDGTAGTSDVDPTLSALATLLGGSVSANAGVVTLHLPTLLELRRRERPS